MTVVLPVKYTVSQLLATAKHLKSTGENWRSANWTDAGRSYPPAHWFDWFFQKLQEKINRNSKILSCKWAAELERINWKINNRIVVHKWDLNCLPAKYKKRLQHRVLEDM